MLVIRAQQMRVFEDAMLRSFETRMVEHCFSFEPRLCKVLGEDRVRSVVRDGIARAAGAGFTNRGPARLYLELMLLFGSDFATDPQYPWAGEVLGSGDASDQMQRADLLYRRILAYQEAVAGPEDTHTRAALAKLPVVARNPLPFSSDDFVSGMLREIGSVYPQKAAFVGDAALERLIREGIEAARSHELLTVRSVALLVVLMFAFGHGCTGDPLYRWIGRTLADPAITTPAARAQRLEQKALTWLEHVLGRQGKDTDR